MGFFLSIYDPFDGYCSYNSLQFITSCYHCLLLFLKHILTAALNAVWVGLVQLNWAGKAKSFRIFAEDSLQFCFLLVNTGPLYKSGYSLVFLVLHWFSCFLLVSLNSSFYKAVESLVWRVISLERVLHCLKFYGKNKSQFRWITRAQYQYLSWTRDVRLTITRELTDERLLTWKEGEGNHLQGLTLVLLQSSLVLSRKAVRRLTPKRKENGLRLLLLFSQCDTILLLGQPLTFQWDPGKGVCCLPIQGSYSFSLEREWTQASELPDQCLNWMSAKVLMMKGKMRFLGQGEGQVAVLPATLFNKKTVLGSKR